MYPNAIPQLGHYDKQTLTYRSNLRLGMVGHVFSKLKIAQQTASFIEVHIPNTDVPMHPSTAVKELKRWKSE